MCICVCGACDDGVGKGPGSLKWEPDIGCPPLKNKGNLYLSNHIGGWEAIGGEEWAEKGGRLKWRGFHGNHEIGHVQKAKLKNRYTHSYIYNMRVARTPEPGVLSQRTEMTTGPSTKV